MTPLKNQRFFNPLLVTLCSKYFRPPLPTCHRPTDDKVFSYKLSAKVYFGFNIVYVYYYYYY